MANKLLGSNPPVNYTLRGNSSGILFTGWVGMREGLCAATRVALDLFGAVATFAYRVRNAVKPDLSDQVLAITRNTTVLHPWYTHLF